MQEHLLIKTATINDTPLIMAFIHELAEYEKSLDKVSATKDSIRQSLFAAHPYAEAVLAYHHEKPAGFAVFFHNYSTYLGRYGLYLEDLFVKPELRGRGFGKKIMQHLARLAKQRGCVRMEWSVLDWNQPAIDFYAKINAQEKNNRITYQLAGDAFDALAR